MPILAVPIAAACRRSGRGPDDVKLVAISKTHPPDSIRSAYEAGLRDFGENRVQEAAAKRPALSDLSITWHLVGHLQTNKAKPARDLFHWVHSVDSFRLAQKLDQATASGGGRLPVLLEVNGAPQWHGLAKATGIDVAAAVIDRALALAGHR